MDGFCKIMDMSSVPWSRMWDPIGLCILFFFFFCFSLSFTIVNKKSTTDLRVQKKFVIRKAEKGGKIGYSRHHASKKTNKYYSLPPPKKKVSYEC